MLVKDYMTRHPMMAEPQMSILEAREYMAEHDIRHLPVAGDGKRLLGLVTRQSLLVEPGQLGSLDVWEISRYLSTMTVGDVMIDAEHVITTGPDTTLEDAARVMVENRIGCLPVVEDEFIVGLITERDLLRQLMEMMGTTHPGVRVTIDMPYRRGELAKLVSAIAAQGWGIIALGGASAPKDPEMWTAVIKLRDHGQQTIVDALSELADQQIVDVRET